MEPTSFLPFATAKCKYSMNFCGFLVDKSDFFGLLVRGIAAEVAQLQFLHKVGKIREPQAQIPDRPKRAVRKPASTALAHYKLRFE